MKKIKVRKTIEKLVTDNSTLSSDSIIERDIAAIKKINIKNDISKFIGNSDSEKSEMSISDMRNLMEVESYIRKGDLEKAYQICAEFREATKDTTSAPSYIRKLIEISDRQGNTNSAVRWCFDLLAIDKYNIKSQLLASKFKLNPKDRYMYLKDLTKEINYSPDLYSEAAISGFKLIKHNPDDSTVNISELIEMVDKSIKIDPSMRNNSWGVKYDLLSFELDINDTNLNSIDQFVGSLIENHPESIWANRLRGSHALKNKKNIDFEKSIDNLYEMHKSSSISRKKHIDEALLYLINEALDTDNFLKNNSIPTNFFENHNINEYGCEYLVYKGSYYLGIMKNIDLAESLLKQSLDHDQAFDNISSILNLSLNIAAIKSASNNSPHSVEFFISNSKLLDLIEESKPYMSKEYFHSVKHNIHLYSGDYASAHTELDHAFDCGYSLSGYISCKSYIYLMSKKYQPLLDFISNYENKISAISDHLSYPILINQEYAKKCIGQNINKVKLMNILSTAKDDDVKICALSLLDRDHEAKPKAINKINYNANNFAKFSLWPVLQGKFVDEINPFKINNEKNQ